MPSATPADVLARRRQLLLDGDIDGFADLFALDGVSRNSRIMSCIYLCQ
jgi:uncharacterized protein